MCKSFNSLITSGTTIILFFFLSICFTVTPKPVIAEDTALREVFTSTIYGLLTGGIIAATLTVADGDAHGEDWARNIGIGGTIGAFVGATYGMAQQTRHFVTFDGKHLTFQIPIPSLSQSKHDKNSPDIFLKLLEWQY